MQTELKIKVICENLPGRPVLDNVNGQSVVREQIHIGLQCGDQVIEAVPITMQGIVFEPSFRVAPMPDGKTNFLGPYAKGPPAQRFFYLSWGVKDRDGMLRSFGRSKIHLSHLSWTQVEEAVGSGQALSVAVSLSDKQEKPRFGTIRGDEVRWG
jgi:hypothetical protein